eukprot:m.119303 g.119303  ORF g.119303 m.119303 type:complete len:53 (+) comp13286_c0_seq1:216-374(+)
MPTRQPPTTLPVNLRGEDAVLRCPLEDDSDTGVLRVQPIRASLHVIVGGPSH